MCPRAFAPLTSSLFAVRHAAMPTRKGRLTCEAHADESPSNGSLRRVRIGVRMKLPEASDGTETVYPLNEGAACPDARGTVAVASDVAPRTSVRQGFR